MSVTIQMLSPTASPSPGTRRASVPTRPKNVRVTLADALQYADEDLILAMWHDGRRVAQLDEDALTDTTVQLRYTDRRTVDAPLTDTVVIEVPGDCTFQP